MAEVRQRRQPQAAPKVETESFPAADESTAVCVDDFSWTNLSTWPMTLKMAPFYLIILGLGTVMLWDRWFGEVTFDMSNYEACKDTFNHTFRINAARHQAEDLAAHSWEYGIAAEAIEELLTPDKTVFGRNPFPDEHVPNQGLHMDPAMIWVYQNIRKNNVTLFDDDWGVSDPASLGVAAVMLGQRWGAYHDAAERQKDFLLKDAPRYINGAISHRQDVAELWSDAVSMFPPFLAYYGVHKKDMALIKEAVRQIQLYRDVLSYSDGPKEHLWKHIAGPSDMADEGAWSTGNGWAAFGMARVRATISGWPPSNATMQEEIKKLDRWIKEIIDGAIRTDDDESGLLRNYLGQQSWWGETSGTALLAATTYRMAVLRPDVFAQPKYLDWVHAKRRAVASRVNEDGFAVPAVNPLKHSSREPVESSPEGASFLLLMGSAWRDCVCRGVCVLEGTA